MNDLKNFHQALSAVSRTAYSVYEEQGVVITEAGALHGDVTVGVGRVRGVTGDRVGDSVTDVDLGGQRRGRYVAELKDRKMSLAAVLKELQAAMAKRDAQAAIAVFSRAEYSPVRAPMRVFGNCIVVVYDKTERDPQALELACSAARWIVQREAGAGSAAEHDLVQVLLEDAQRALRKAVGIRSGLTAARKGVDQAASNLADMTTDLTAAITRFEKAVAAADPLAG